ncbi:ABC transporter permease [Xanthomonas massiliensis]|uniref:ABC transporter permease n=1 Tax=Xanthomonas massiliensis TaxID=1720302 RepID=UPI00082714F8|nr:ABC transporter permease [Xanthomonas massiliensis]
MVLLLAWSLASDRGWIDARTLPSPLQVLQTLAGMARNGEAWDSLSISLQRVLAGCALGAVAGLLLGMAMGTWRTVHALVHPAFRALACVPVLGWLPLLMLLLGIGEALKIVLIAKAAFIPVALNTSAGIRAVPVSWLEVADVYGLGAWQRWTRVALPAALPAVWTGLRYGLTSCWLVLVLVELLASSEGLGYLMSNGQQLMQLDVLLACVVMIGAMGFGLDRLLQAVERWLLRWRGPGGLA